ncbi:MAG TPA: glycosyltransferase family A protein [Steroidobacteraceae bacterium]|nr:glycosyltransferase family A protein [Steroidobacteraceae bacterium]
MELISVIMPTHNSARWVTYTIDNLACQTYPHFELIVADDGSQDDTVAVMRRRLASFKNPWRLIEMPRNRGPSAARNLALKAAQGTWVQYLDSDDFIAPTKFELQLARCARVAADVAAVYSPWTQCHIDEDRVTPLGQMIEPDMEGRAPVLCLLGPERMLLGSGLIRRTVLERIGGSNEALRFWECEELNFRIAKAGRLEHVPSPSPLYFWRQHRGRGYIGGAEARYHATPVALNWIELLLQGLDYKSLDEAGLSARDRKNILTSISYWARELFGTDRRGFRKFLARARRVDPNLAPTYPALIAAVSKHIGYEAAEAIAHLGRAPKQYLRKFRQGLRLLVAANE